MRVNIKAQNLNRTHEGGQAVPRITPIQQLRRSVMSCMLWENEFYENGQEIAERIEQAANAVTVEQLAATAIEARSKFSLRHVPLGLLVTLIKRANGGVVSDAIANVIQRPDELGELLALYWNDKTNKHMIPHVMARGMSEALGKFTEYSLAKYDRDDAEVKLRDVLRIVRPKPVNDVQRELWGRIVRRKLKIPDTWEVELSAGKDKKETFERLLRENKLGYLALLRNLRNMAQAQVDEKLVNDAIIARRGGAERVFPFRYVAAARAAAQFEPAIDRALCAAIGEMPPLPGKTIVLVDVSGSMDGKLSARSGMRRVDAAAALASIINGDLEVWIFNNVATMLPARRGMAGVDNIAGRCRGATELGHAVTTVNARKHDRLIVITDEQSEDCVPDPTARHAYMINVASYKNGVGYGRWTHLDGFSEQVIRFITETERDGE